MFIINIPVHDLNLYFFFLNMEGQLNSDECDDCFFFKALGCYWVTTNFISLFQAFLFTLKPVKKFFNIPEIVQVAPQNNKGNKSLREIYQDLKEDSARK